MARGVKFGAREAYAVVEILPDGKPAEQAIGLYTYKRHANALRNVANRSAEPGRFKTVPVVLTWHLEAAE